ncbi:18927_t:CDS:2 [Entrophospora sp. SA101]|nr:18927_t:CDS:2 [Entrophospora sp. SA101]
MNNNYPVTANEKIVEGLKTIPNLSSFSSNIPPSKISVSIITPPKITKTILEEAAKNEKIVEGLKTIPNLSSFSSNIPPSKISVSIITPPKITKTILEEAAKLGITKIWLQPGAENLDCQTFAVNNNIKLISGGPCVLVDGPKL